AVEKALPEASPSARALQTCLDGCTQRSRQPSERTEARGQKRLELLSQPARQYRRIATARHRHDDRRTIHECRHDEARQLATVDNVHRNPAPLGLVRDPCIDCMLAPARDDDALALEQLRA